MCLVKMKALLKINVTHLLQRELPDICSLTVILKIEQYWLINAQFKYLPFENENLNVKNFI